jgi:glycosyltransferase involved in cell wall biosynthesis
LARIAVIVSNPCRADARVIKMARAAAEAGHEVHVFATAGQGAPLYEHAHGVTYHRLDWRPGALMTAVPPLSWIAGASHRLATWLVKRLAPYLKYRLFARTYAPPVAALAPDLIHAHDLICLPAALAAAQECGAEVVYDAHELEVHRNPPLPMLQRWWVARTEHRHARRAAAVITVGRLVAGVLGRHLGRDDIEVLYNSPMVAPCRRNIRDDLGLRTEVPLVIYVGKVTRGRGVGELLAILPKMAGVFLATVGPCDDATREWLETQAERAGVARRFRILPPVPFDQVVTYIHGADLGAISVEPVTLSYQYCMPNKLFELSFADVPIISNELDEIAEFLAEVGNGEIVDLTDGASLPYRIVRMLGEKPRYRIADAGRQRLDERYSWAAQARRLDAIYARVLQARGERAREPAP